GGLGDRLPQAPGRPARRLDRRAELLRRRLLHRQRGAAQALIRLKRIAAEAPPAGHSNLWEGLRPRPLWRPPERQAWRPKKTGPPTELFRFPFSTFAKLDGFLLFIRRICDARQKNVFMCGGSGWIARG